jgi:hypothetical protein
MKNVKFDERELAEIFQVEELEKRYEMGWLSGGEVKGEATYSQGQFSVEVSVSIPLN